MDEPVGLDAGPVVDLVRRDVFGVDGHVGRGEGVGALGSDHGHQLVIFIRYGNLGGLVADGVDLMVDGHPLRRVGLRPVHLEKGPDRIEQRLLGLIVGGSEVLGALEHQVLEIVGEACGLVRVVLASDFHGDVGLEPRLLLVDRHVDLQAVVHRVDPGVHRIPLYGLVPVLRAGNRHQKGKCDKSRGNDSFHCLLC